MADDPSKSTPRRADEGQQNQEADKDRGSALGRFSRRSFLSHLGAAGLAATTPPLLARAETHAEPAPDGPEAIPGAVSLTLRVNGAEHRLKVDPRATLLDALREGLDLTGTKKGCDHGQCGACTVHVNGRRVNSCMSFALMHGKDEIKTIEGLGQPDRMHPMQAAFVEHDAYQCGYCTSGQIMSATALVREPWGPADEDVQQGMSGNICRCGAYANIVAAVQQTRRQA